MSSARSVADAFHASEEQDTSASTRRGSDSFRPPACPLFLDRGSRAVVLVKASTFLIHPSSGARARSRGNVVLYW